MRPTVMRSRLLLLVWLALWCGVRAAPAPAEPARLTAAIEAVHAIGMSVSDMERSVAFYTNVLSFEVVSDVEEAGDAYDRLYGLSGIRMRVVRLRLGDEDIVLTEYLRPKGRPVPVDSRSNDRWFQHIAIIVSDMERAYAWLRHHNVEHVSPWPQRLPDWNLQAAGIEAFYFRDPDGHVLEILQFPAGKGHARWHRQTDRLFLGIDHTAIVVGNTDVSLRFYRDVLGFKVVGASENYGPEQERLNHVPGARLRITTLRSTAGPAIEFLEYLNPRDGRPTPGDTHANDLWHWHTMLLSPQVDAVARLAQASGFSWVSTHTVTLPESTLGFTKGVLIRDADGHVMQLIER